MTTPDLTCTHRFCGQPIVHGYARFKLVEGLEGLQPFHAGCVHAHRDYDVSRGLGSPFITVTGPAGVTTGAST